MSPAVQPNGNDRDAGVVEEICGYITGNPPRSFFLFAGAGSGKTRTLVEVLRRLTGVVPHDSGTPFARRLRSRGQSIRVVTYTKNAVAVVKGRLGDNHLTSVSTIHSFCWDLIEGFDEDIRDALLALKATELEAAREKAAAKKKGENERDREKFVEMESEANEIRSTKTFIYHPDRNTYGSGALQHAQVLAVAAWLLRERPTLQRILTDQHPVILIDESQDTMKGVLDALLNVADVQPPNLTLGLLGDHRQRIYAHGHSDLPGHVPEAWARPKLEMNHRSQQRIVDLINRIWEADVIGRTQPKTGVRQHSRTEKNGGVVRIFVGDTRLDSESKIRKEKQCALVMAKATSLEAWSEGARGYQVLALEHKLAATRGAFLDVFLAMDLLDPESAAPQGNAENKGPSMVQVLLGPMSELAACIGVGGQLDEFAATGILHRHSQLTNLPDDATLRQARLSEIHKVVTDFAKACMKADASVRDVLSPVVLGGLFDIDSRMVQAFRDTSLPPEPPVVKTKESKEDRRKRGWHALFSSPWIELARYRDYLSGKAELATHQVVKGSEFEHVMVVMDDENAGGFLFSYDKLFGAVELSDKDMENMRDNNETTIDRTLRLLYVTCSRARQSLALVLWAKDPQAALTRIRAGSWFSEAEVEFMP